MVNNISIYFTDSVTENLYESFRKFSPYLERHLSAFLHDVYINIKLYILATLRIVQYFVSKMHVAMLIKWLIFDILNYTHFGVGNQYLTEIKKERTIFMNNNRTKNASRNMLFGSILKIYQIFVPFLMRTAMIYLMGVQYLGLNNLFTSILQVLNLAELGVGAAMVYTMYKPIAESDVETICALLKLYRTYHRIIGLIIACVGTLLTPFVPKLINGTVPEDINIYVMYLLNLGATVLSYWLFAYKNSLLHAHQRADMTSKVALITNTFQYVVQILALWLFHNYYLYVIVALFTQAVTNIVTAIVATKMYPKYQPSGKLDERIVKEINQRIKDLFTAKVGGVIVGSADSIVISVFMGLTTLAVYQNYFYIVSAIYGLFLVLSGAVTAGIGNSLVIESIEKNYNDLKKFTFIICWFASICVCCFAVLYQPFMRLWVGEKFMLDDSYVILFCVYFYVVVLSMVWGTIKDAAGLWHYDRLRPLISAIVNLVINLILVQFVGLYGILLSTIISYVFISMPWMLRTLFKLLYNKRGLRYIGSLILYITVCIISCLLTVTICNKINCFGIERLIANGAVAVIVPNILQLICFWQFREFKESKDLILKIIKGC